MKTFLLPALAAAAAAFAMPCRADEPAPAENVREPAPAPAEAGLSKREIGSILSFKQRLVAAPTIDFARLSERELDWLEIAFVAEIIECEAEIDGLIDADKAEAAPIRDAIGQLEANTALLPAFRTDFSPRRQAQLEANVRSFSAVAKQLAKEVEQDDGKRVRALNDALGSVANYLLELFPADVVAKAQRVAAEEARSQT